MQNLLYQLQYLEFNILRQLYVFTFKVAPLGTAIFYPIHHSITAITTFP